MAFSLFRAGGTGRGHGVIDMQCGADIGHERVAAVLIGQRAGEEAFFQCGVLVGVPVFAHGQQPGSLGVFMTVIGFCMPGNRCLKPVGTPALDFWWLDGLMASKFLTRRGR